MAYKLMMTMMIDKESHFVLPTSVKFRKLY